MVLNSSVNMVLVIILLISTVLLRLIIEVDGKVHLTREQKEKDQFRDANLIDMGFQVMRFTNEEVLFNAVEVIRKL